MKIRLKSKMTDPGWETEKIPRTKSERICKNDLQRFCAKERILRKGVLCMVNWDYVILAWRIPRTEEAGRLPSIGSQRLGHDWSDLACMHPFIKYLLSTRLCVIIYVIFVLSYSDQLSYLTKCFETSWQTSKISNFN